MHAWLEIDLDAIVHNFGVLRETLGDTEIMAVIKSDAYGHGIPAVAKTLDACGVDRFATISFDEAERARSVTDKDILLLGYLEDREIEEAVRRGYVLSLYDRALADLVQETAMRVGKKARVHVKVESGMNRLGMSRPEAMEVLTNLWRFDGIKVEGLYTHVYRSSDVESLKEQMAAFRPMLELAETLNLKVTRHMINSHALLPFPEGRLDMVRVGLGLYGVEEIIPGLRPSIRAAARVLQVKKVAAGEGISYNHLYRAKEDMMVAVVSMGYAEGYTQALTGKTSALIHGRKVPLLGQISMNLTMIDVTGIPAVRGDEVVFVGRQGEEEILVSDLAKVCGLRHHELVTRMGHGMPRIYTGTKVELPSA